MYQEKQEVDGMMMMMVIMKTLNSKVEQNHLALVVLDYRKGNQKVSSCQVCKLI